MDHPDVTHAMQTGYPEGGEPEPWTGTVHVLLSIDVDIAPEDTCHDVTQAKAEAIHQVRSSFKGIYDVQVKSCEKANEDEK